MDSLNKTLKWACEVIVKIANNDIDRVHYPTHLVHGKAISDAIAAVRFLDEISFLHDDEREDHIDEMSRSVSDGLTRIITYSIVNGKVKVLESINALSIHIPLDEYLLSEALLSGHTSVIRFLIGTAISPVASYIVHKELNKLGDRVSPEIQREVNKWLHNTYNKHKLNVRR